jgi:hypothetical protein
MDEGGRRFFRRSRELRTCHSMAADISGIEQNFERRLGPFGIRNRASHRQGAADGLTTRLANGGRWHK